MKVHVIEGHLVHEHPGHAAPWILLHGFTGSPMSFAALRQRLPKTTGTVALTLPGHGPLPLARAEQSFDDAVDALARVLRAYAPAPMLGYSLGGRLAMGLLRRHPHLISRLVAIAAHPGLHDRAAAQRRRQADQRLAAGLRQNGREAFMATWQDLPLFASQRQLPPALLEAQRRVRRQHDAGQLAAALEQLSLGGMPTNAPATSRAHQPVDLLVGAKDHKFVALNQELARGSPRCRLHIVEDVGHNVLLEAPGAVARLMVERRRLRS